MKKVIIFDLDETLIHSRDISLNMRSDDFRCKHLFTYKRNHLDSFLEFCFNHFDVAIWSSGSLEYINDIVKNIMPERELLFIRSKSHCSSVLVNNKNNGISCPRFSLVKDFSTLPTEIKERDVVVIEDKPDVYINSNAEMVHVPQFLGKMDNDLKYVKSSLLRHI